MDNPWDTLRKRLLTLRDTHGAVAEFCRSVGINRQTAENWLDGRSVPGVDRLDRIASALSTTPAALLDPGTPPIPAKVASLLPLLATADDGTLNAIRDLLAGYAKRLEQSPPQDRQQLPNQRKKPGK